VGGGVEFPIYPPPGIIILLAGAVFVSLAPWPWAPAVGAFLGLFVTVGFLVSGGPPNLVGREGTSVAIGTWIQMLGVLTALVAGVMATRATYRNRTPARQ
jgi:protein-S-isoprenylcysteine O-methyltransferase Ste14